jgi:RNA polymerase sigma-70 factor (ECF subfamily)
MEERACGMEHEKPEFDSAASTSAEFMRHWLDAQSALSGYIHGMIRDHHLAEDLLQDVAVQLMAKFAEYDASRSFRGWALGFAKNAVLRSRRDFRRSRLIQNTELYDRLTEAYGEVADEENGLRPHLRACLGQVKGRSREMLQMRYWRDMGLAEIADHLGMSGVAVRVAMMRVRNFLERCMRERETAELRGEAMP